jgi:hypothetical protein
MGSASSVMVVDIAPEMQERHERHERHESQESQVFVDPRPKDLENGTWYNELIAFVSRFTNSIKYVMGHGNQYLNV